MVCDDNDVLHGVAMQVLFLDGAEFKVGLIDIIPGRSLDLIHVTIVTVHKLGQVGRCGKEYVKVVDYPDLLVLEARRHARKHELEAKVIDQVCRLYPSQVTGARRRKAHHGPFAVDLQPVVEQHVIGLVDEEQLVFRNANSRLRRLVRAEEPVNFFDADNYAILPPEFL